MLNMVAKMIFSQRVVEGDWSVGLGDGLVWMNQLLENVCHPGFPGSQVVVGGDNGPEAAV